MSVTEHPHSASSSPKHSYGAPRSAAALWGYTILACGLLATSGGVRAWQARRVEKALEAGRRVAWLDLETVPWVLGPWRGEVFKIDEQIARGTGADQIVTRRYVNEATGAAVELILLYGPAAETYLHSPEVCYPSAGYHLAAGPDLKQIDAVPFRALAYRKGEGVGSELQEVYYSWRYGGRWSPEVGIQKRFERIPSMYKVHVARRAGNQERRDVGNPCEIFLAALMPEIRVLLERVL